MAAVTGGHFLHPFFQLHINVKIRPMTIQTAHALGVGHKTCSKCQALKPATEFNFRSRAVGARHSYCRDCGKGLTHSHYARNKQSYLARNARTYSKFRELIRTAKSRPCADCGVQYPYYVMDFDHRDGASKEFALNSVKRKTEKAILREIEQCDVVCSNCHRERTHQRSLGMIDS